MQWARPTSAHWQQLGRRQALLLLLIGLLLEGPGRWLLRPHVHDLLPQTPSFDLRLRLAVEGGFVAIFLVAASMAGGLAASGMRVRHWSRLEWLLLGVVGGIETAGRWGQLPGPGGILGLVAWILSESLFGFNQETGFRGLLMTGLLRLSGPFPAIVLNSLLFTFGPLHGGGHLADWFAHPAQHVPMIVAVAVSGLFFSCVRYVTDNVLLVGILHGLVNGLLNGSALALRG